MIIKRVIFFLVLSGIFFVVLPTQVSFAAPCTGDKRDCRGVCIDKNTICLNLSYPSFGGFNLGTNQDLVSIIGWLYYAIVTISGLAAFVMLVWGGIQWLTSSGNPGQIKDAQSRMSDALLGLGLVLGSYLILTIINPGLTTLEQPKLDAIPITEVIPAPKSKPAPSTGSKPTPSTTPIQFADSFPPEETDARTRINAILGSSGVANMGYCGGYTFQRYRESMGEGSDCLNILGLPDITYDVIRKIGEECLECNVVITGGAENGHPPNSHGVGIPALDFSWNDNLASYLHREESWFATRICTQATDSAYRKGGCDYDEPERHLHVKFTDDYFANLRWSRDTASVGDFVMFSADTLLPAGQNVQVVVMDDDPLFNKDDEIRTLDATVLESGTVEFSWEILQDDYDKGGWGEGDLEAYAVITYNGKIIKSSQMAVSSLSW